MATIEERAKEGCLEQYSPKCWVEGYIKGATDQKTIDMENIDQFCEEHWEEYFKSRSDMKVFKGWLKKAIKEDAK